MKKNILIATFMVLTFALAGCGSNDKVDTPTQSSTRSDRNINMVSSMDTQNNRFVLDVKIIKSLDKTYTISFSDFKLSFVKGCEIDSVDVPSPFKLSGGVGSYKNIQFFGTFKNECDPKGYQIDFVQTVTDGKRSKTDNTTYQETIPSSSSSTGGEIDKSPKNGFFNADTPLIITKSNQDYNISVQVLTGGYASKGKIVKIKAFDRGYGTISNPTTVTGDDGYAIFKYKSPAVMPANGSSVILEITNDENGTVIFQNILLTFNSSGGGGTEPLSQYNLINANGIKIHYPNERKEIFIQVVKSDTNTPSSGQEVTVKSIPFTFGRIEQATVQSGADGYARFTYIAADPLLNGTQSLEFIHTDKNGVSVTTNVDIVVEKSIDQFEYNLTNESTPINITRANQVEVISVYLVDAKTGVGIAGKSISISTVESKYGDIINASTISTTSTGKAEFSYKAPDNIDEIDSRSTTINISFTDNGTTIAKKIELNFHKDVINSDYRLVNAKDITIEYAGEGREIAVQIIDKDNKPVERMVISAKSIPIAFGHITATSVLSGTDGYARFNYIAADPLTNGIQPLELVYTNSNNVSTSTTINIKVDATTQSSNYDMVNVSTPITIGYGSQKQDIRAQLTYKNIPIAGKIIKLQAFDNKKGTITNQYTIQTDKGGYAIFNYMAPENIDDINGTSIILTMLFEENSIYIEKNVTIKFDAAATINDGNTTLPIVVIPNEYKEIELGSNSKVIEFNIKVFKDIAPYAQGFVKVELPKKVLDGVDVGSFDKYSVAVDAQGIAHFRYTGPSNIAALVANDDNNSIFKFYHTENASEASEIRMNYILPEHPYLYRNYEITILTTDKFSMGIPEKEKSFNVKLTARDGSGNLVELDNENITKISIASENNAIAQILDTTNNSLVSTLDIEASNGSQFILKSKNKSGIVPIQVTMEFTDANEKTHLIDGGDFPALTTIVNIRVFSGPPTAISISYVSTEQDKDRSKYIEIFAVSAVDEYGNKINTRPNISLGVLAGYAVDGKESSSNETNETKRLYYGKFDTDNGFSNGQIINLLDDVNSTDFEDNTNDREDVFKYINAEGNNTDKLVVFGEGKNYEAMGKWDISLGGNSHTLTLQDDYYGADREGLYYAVGHNYYQDQCMDDGREWVGHTDSQEYQLDEEGTAIISYKHDYHLGGKSVMVWANLEGQQPDREARTRIGEATRRTLRTTGLVSLPTGGYILDANTTAVVEFEIWHKNAPERYRNAKFTFELNDGKHCPYTIISSSNNYDARTCDTRQSYNGYAFGNNYGGAFISFLLKAPEDEGCEFNIQKIKVASEF